MSARSATDVFTADSDERLEYLYIVNPELTEEHLDQIATVTDQWLNNQAKERIRAMARRAYDGNAEPGNMVIHWATSEEIKRLADLLMETSIPDKTLAIGYAMVTARHTAGAAFLNQSQGEMSRSTG